MITNELKIAAKEFNEILNNMVPSEYILKIPEKFRNFLKEIENKEYICQIDLNKNIDEQNITEKTKDLITVVYRNYWCNTEEREELDKILTENEKKYQEELIKKYNPDNLFKEQKVDTESHNTTETSMIIYKNNLFNKIKEYLKRIFKRI